MRVLLVEDRVAGLDAGADDYLVKPFDLSELSARVAAVARRYRGNPNPLVHVGDLVVDLGDHRISRNGQPVELTAREWALFEGFLQRPGILLSRAQLGCTNSGPKLRAILSKSTSAVCAKNWDTMP